MALDDMFDMETRIESVRTFLRLQDSNKADRVLDEIEQHATRHNIALPDDVHNLRRTSYQLGMKKSVDTARKAYQMECWEHAYFALGCVKSFAERLRVPFPEEAEAMRVKLDSMDLPDHYRWTFEGRHSPL